MTGGFLQLAAYGAQDIILTGNPQITFFVSVYKRYTNFSIETIEQFFHGKVDFGRLLWVPRILVRQKKSSCTVC